MWRLERSSYSSPVRFVHSSVCFSGALVDADEVEGPL